jgi:hypothetical protein
MCVPQWSRLKLAATTDELVDGQLKRILIEEQPVLLVKLNDTIHAV